MRDSILHTKDVRQKIKYVEEECHHLLSTTQASVSIPFLPARDISVLPKELLAERVGLSYKAGQAHLLHDLANIELQAMELGIRTLHEYASARYAFREQLVQVILDEARHLQLCLNAIESLGFKWGDWPIHSNLWTATSSQDSLLDRILIVHCYLEGSGLDSSEQILRRLAGVINPTPREVVKVIAEEERAHVKFGLTWYKEFCKGNNVNSDDDFGIRLKKLSVQLPKRSQFISSDLRLAVGFTPKMISDLRQFLTQ